MGDLAPLVRVMHGQVPGLMTEVHPGPLATSRMCGLLDNAFFSTILSKHSSLISLLPPPDLCVQ
eukprot:8331212-Prorocentrum_lima.AAC.1